MAKYTKEYRKEIRERVRRGVAVLDAYVPKWWKLVKLSTFKIDSSYKCVIGQIGNSKQVDGDDILYSIYSRYTLMSEDLAKASVGGWHPTWNSDHGFDLSAEEDSSVYEYLQELWTKEIRKRKGLKRG